MGGLNLEVMTPGSVGGSREANYDRVSMRASSPSISRSSPASKQSSRSLSNIRCNAAWMLGYFIAARFANFACRFARSSGHLLEPVAIRLHTGGCRRALDCTVGALGRYDVTPSSTCLMKTPAFLNGINVILHASFRRDAERAGPSLSSTIQPLFSRRLQDWEQRMRAIGHGDRTVVCAETLNPNVAVMKFAQEGV
jgi:hypothetical protein